MSIEENNKLIAEFMGVFHQLGTYHLPQHKRYEKIGAKIELYDTFLLEDLSYHTSWDWLMPVVEKIENLDCLYDFTIDKNRGVIKTKLSADNVFRFNEDYFTSSKLEIVYKAVVEFINWYNENKED